MAIQMKPFPGPVLSLFTLLISLFSAHDARAQGVRVKLPAWTEPVMLDTLRQNQEVRAPADVVYRAVMDAYKSLDIPAGNTNGQMGIIGSERFERMRSLAGAPMSLSFNCGDGATGPNADSFKLTIAIVSWVRPDDKGNTILGIASAAAGQGIEGVRRNPRECASTGRVEEKILKEVKRLTGG
jgi:hypothetical protein